MPERSKTISNISTVSTAAECAEDVQRVRVPDLGRVLHPGQRQGGVRGRLQGNIPTFSTVYHGQLELETKVAVLPKITRSFTITEKCLKFESFQPGEGPSRGLLSDCKTSRNLRQPSFQALVVRDNSG